MYILIEYRVVYLLVQQYHDIESKTGTKFMLITNNLFTAHKYLSDSLFLKCCCKSLKNWCGEINCR